MPLPNQTMFADGADNTIFVKNIPIKEVSEEQTTDSDFAEFYANSSKAEFVHPLFFLECILSTEVLWIIY